MIPIVSRTAIRFVCVTALASLVALGCSGGSRAKYVESGADWDGAFPALGNTLQEVLAGLHGPRTSNNLVQVSRLEIVRTDVEPWRTIEMGDVRSGRVIPSADQSYAVIAVIGCVVQHQVRRYRTEVTAWYVLPNNALAAWEHYTWEEPCILFPDYRPAVRPETIDRERAVVARMRAHFPEAPVISLYTYQRGLALVRAGRISDAEAALAKGDAEIDHYRGSDLYGTGANTASSDTVRLRSGEKIHGDPNWTRDARQGLLDALAASRGAGGGARDAAGALVELARYHFPSTRSFSATAMEDIARAEPILRRALDIYDRDPTVKRAERAEALAMLAEAVLAQGRAREAADLHRRALRLRERTLGEDHRDVARSLRQYGGALLDVGDVDGAVPVVERAEAFWKAAPDPDPIERAELAMVRARLELARARPDRAREVLSRALASESGGLGRKNPWFTQVRHLLALAHAEVGDLDAAARELDLVLARYEAWLSSTHPIVGIAAHQRARIAERQGDVALALAHQRRAQTILESYQRNLFLAGTEEQRRQVAAAVRPYADYSVALGIAAARPEGDRLAFAAMLHSKGRVLDAVRGDRERLAKNLVPEDRDLLDHLAAARGEWARRVVAGERAPAGGAPDLEPIEREVRQLEAAMAARSAMLARHAPPVVPRDVLASLPARGALIEFASYERPAVDEMLNRFAGPSHGRRHYAACVLRHGAQVACVDLGPADRVEEQIRLFRRAVAAPAGPDPRPAARALDETVMQPVRALLGEETDLVLSPDGALNLVPFGALRDEGDRVLVDRYTLRYVTSGRDLVRAPARRGLERDAIIADPDFEGDPGAGRSDERRASRAPDLGSLRFGRLEGTAGEAREVEALLPGAAVLTGPAAREDAIKSLESPRVLHIATHGYFLPSRSKDASVTRRIGPFATVRAASADEPMLRSGLALAGANRRDGTGEDGLLTAAELAQVDLQGTELVVLSACDTGVGDVEVGEGVYGLRRAVTLAGAEFQLVTLWKVNDGATRELMARYYGRLASGAGRSEALRAVQLEFLKSPSLSHPYYWASFVPLGASGPLAARAAATP